MRGRFELDRAIYISQFVQCRWTHAYIPMPCMYMRTLVHARMGKTMYIKEIYS